MTRDTDTMLVQACIHGDRSAFADLVGRYERPLFNAAYRVTGSVEDAMDATQAAFVRAFENLGSYDPSRRFFSWIYRIVLNQSLNIVGKRRLTTELNSETPARANDPEATCAASEMVQHLELALMQLEPEGRAMILLKHIEGFSYREIGEVLGIHEKTVKSRLFVARRKLRSILKQHGVSP